MLTGQLSWVGAARAEMHEDTRPRGSARVRRSVAFLELDAKTRSIDVGSKAAVDGRECAVEQDRFESDVVGEVLEVSQVPHTRAGVRADRRGGVGGQVDAAGVGQGPDPQE